MTAYSPSWEQREGADLCFLVTATGHKGMAWRCFTCKWIYLNPYPDFPIVCYGNVESNISCLDLDGFDQTDSRENSWQFFY